MNKYNFGNCFTTLVIMISVHLHSSFNLFHLALPGNNKRKCFVVWHGPTTLLFVLFLLLSTNFTTSLYAQEIGRPSSLPMVQYHLTARPWAPLNINRNTYLDKVEGIVRGIVLLQDSTGAIIDPYANSEKQYSTPYFAFAVATLVSAGRAKDLLDEGIAAMNKATQDVAEGASSIPDNHGEFFLAPLSNAILLFTPFVTVSQLQTWKSRMAKPVNEIIRGIRHNWRTYAMKGEWYRAKNGYINKATAVNWIENSWIYTQKKRLTNNVWHFYHDSTSNPDTWPYESAARGNLLAMIADGYDGASRNEIVSLLQKGTQASLILQDPSGQGVAGGRSGNHTWNDIVLANAYETMAAIAYSAGNAQLAGQYRRAAALGFQSAQRWKRRDGTYSVTKNHFDPKDRVRHALYSFFTNYNGYMMYHMAENYLRSNASIQERPVPSEIGGYTLVSDTSFATAVANAGGMHMQVCLKGSATTNNYLYWTTLGVVRFARPGWDSRLGPSDGVRETTTNLGVSFAPTFLEGGKWVRVASMPERYEAFFSTQFTHPLLVRCRVEYKPKKGQTGPSFTNDFVITPDGILSTLVSSLASNYGITWPLLTFDGATQLNSTLSTHIASTAFPGHTDKQNYIALHPFPTITATDKTRRSSYGDLLPVRMVSGAGNNVTFIYPSSAGDPSADSLKQSLRYSGAEFSSLLGSVKGNVYIGRTAAGGVGRGLDLDHDSTLEVSFDSTTGFLLQLRAGEITRIETDRPVRAIVYGQRMELQAYTPVAVKQPWKVPIAKVVASATDGSNVPLNTVDRDYNTRWSALGVGQWIRYELDTTEVLNAVKIAWYKGEERRASFAIQNSLDTNTWTTVFTGQSSGGSPYFESYTIPTTSARYVRIVGQGNNLNTWNAITEVEFNKATAAKVVASATDGSNVPLNTVDRDYNTRWSALGVGQWIRYELDTTEVLNAVKIAWYKGKERQAFFDVQLSLDNINWTAVYMGQSSGQTDSFETYNIPTTSARYVRIVGRGNTFNAWNAITEIEFVNASGKPLAEIVKADSPRTSAETEELGHDHEIDKSLNANTGILNLQASSYR